MLALPFTPAATLLLLTAGLLLITLEFNRPGLIVAGATGLLATLLAIASLIKLPHAPFTLALLAVSALAFTRDLRRPNLLLAISGTVALLSAYVVIAAISPHKGSFVLAAICAPLVGVTTGVLARIAHRARVNKGLD